MKMEYAPHTTMHYTVFEENTGALGLATSTRTTTRTRQIAVKYHFFRKHVGEGKGIMIQRVEYKEQKNDVFTKLLPA